MAWLSLDMIDSKAVALQLWREAEALGGLGRGIPGVPHT